jgi:hypothetical protein
VEAALDDDRIRLADLMAALSLATDLGLGQPLEHELGVCLAGVRLRRLLRDGRTGLRSLASPRWWRLTTYRL